MQVGSVGKASRVGHGGGEDRRRDDGPLVGDGREWVSGQGASDWGRMAMRGGVVLQGWVGQGCSRLGRAGIEGRA